MKAFTDIEQSKKLAKILPIESADMAWCNNSIKGVNYTDQFSANLHTVKEMRDVFDEALRGWNKYWELIPCWSLAALLSVFPMVVGKDLDMYCCWQNSKNLHSRHYDNPIDACYEMIVKLKEKGLI